MITLQQLVIATYLILFLTGIESLLVFTITDWHRRKIKCGACTFLRCAKPRHRIHIAVMHSLPNGVTCGLRPVAVMPAQECGAQRCHSPAAGKAEGAAGAQNCRGGR